jgi:hypothetical protein
LDTAVEEFELWSEHLPVVNIFLRACRQWLTAGETILGINMMVLPVIAKLLDIELTIDLLDDLQIMEARAVEILNKGTKKQQRRRRTR